MLQEKIPKKIITVSVFCVFGLICLCINPNILWFFLSFFLGEWSGGAMRISVTSTSDDRPIFSFDQHSIDYRRHPFSSLYIWDFNPADPIHSTAVWKLAQDDAHWDEPLQTLTYGVCPPNFTELSPAKPLLSGHYYRVIASEDIVKKLGPCKYTIVRYGSLVKPFAEPF